MTSCRCTHPQDSRWGTLPDKIEANAAKAVSNVAFSEDPNCPRKNLGLKLYYFVLERLYAKEADSKTNLNWLTSISFHNSLLACCFQIVVFSYKVGHLQFPTVLTAFNVSAWEFLKVIESVVRHNPDLPRTTKAHLRDTEFAILERHAWVTGEPLRRFLDRPESRTFLTAAHKGPPHPDAATAPPDATSSTSSPSSPPGSPNLTSFSQLSQSSLPDIPQVPVDAAPSTSSTGAETRDAATPAAAFAAAIANATSSTDATTNTSSTSPPPTISPGGRFQLNKGTLRRLVRFQSPLTRAHLDICPCADLRTPPDAQANVSPLSFFRVR